MKETLKKQLQKNINIDIEEIEKTIKYDKQWIENNDKFMILHRKTYKHYLQSMFDELLRQIKGEYDMKVENLEKRIRDFVNGVYSSYKNSGLDADEFKNLINNYYGVEKKQDYQEFAKKYGYDQEFIRDLKYQFIRKAHHPYRVKKASFVPEILDVLMIEEDYVSFDKLRDALDVDYQNFLIAFNITDFDYRISKDGKGIQKITLQYLASKVLKNEMHELDPDVVFAEYIEHYKGYEIEIDSKVFAEILKKQEEKGTSAKTHDLILDNIFIPKEIGIYVRNERDIFKKILEKSSDEYVCKYLKECLNIKD